MGGCASKPKETDSLPSEAPISPKKAEPESIAQEKTNGGENQNEAPLVDLSEPKEEAKNLSSESKAADAEPVSGDATVKANPAEDKVEATVTKDKVEATVTKDKVEAAEPAKEAEVKDQDKSDAPLVTV